MEVHCESEYRLRWATSVRRSYRAVDLEDLEGDLSLHNLCRWAIRRHLLSVNHVNLLITVPKLGLPTRLEKYLLEVPLKEVKTEVKWENDDVT